MMWKRRISLALVLALALACLPLSGGIALAGEADIEAPLASMTDEDAGSGIVSGEAEAGVEEIEMDLGWDQPEEPVEYDVFPAADGWESDAASPGDACMEVLASADGWENEDVIPDDAWKEVLASVADDAETYVPKDASHSVQVTQKGGTVSIKGEIAQPYVLFGVIVDSTVVSEQYFGNSVDFQFDINNGSFSTGYHTVYVGVGTLNPDGSVRYDNQVLQQKYVEANLITDTPSSKGELVGYHNYVNFYPYNNILWGNAAGTLYMEYSADKGKTWKRYGPMTCNAIKLAIEQNFKITGLKPNTTYRSRLRFGEVATYSTEYGGDGESYVFLGPALKGTTFKTGKKKAPKIDSVTAKATNVKYHKNRVQPHYEWTAGYHLVWIGSWTERYYTCNVKVTVKLKEKPGTKGLWIGFTDMSGTQEKWVKGNQKSYTVTFTPYPNYFSKKPKGNYTFEITVRSGQSKALGGYSPRTSKKKKLS